MNAPGGNRLRILTVNSHQPYLHLLRRLPHEFTVMDGGLTGFPCGWDPGVRPLPDNFRVVSLSEAAAAAQREPFSVALAHNVTDLLALQEFCSRLVILFHSTLSGRIVYEGSRTSPREFVARVRHYLSYLPTEIVFISELKRRSWGDLGGRIIQHGIPLDDYQGYTGEQPAVLRVANLQGRREVLLNHSLQQEILHGIPTTLLGSNPEVKGAAPAASWQELKAAYRSFRCFLVTNHPELEDGFNLAVLEAMATGMPVVTTPHPTTPIRHGVNGLIGQDATALRRHVSRLLHDRALAVRLGQEARRTVERRFSHESFLSAWGGVFRFVAEQEETPGESVAGRHSRPRLTVIPGGRPATADAWSGPVRPAPDPVSVGPEGKDGEERS